MAGEAVAVLDGFELRVMGVPASVPAVEADILPAEAAGRQGRLGRRLVGAAA